MRDLAPRRLASALLAGFVLLASLASVAHGHAPADRHAAPSLAASVAHHADAALAGAELGCALCATGARLGHGASAAPASAPVVAPRVALADAALAGAPPFALLARASSRAPPRLG